MPQGTFSRSPQGCFHTPKAFSCQGTRQRALVSHRLQKNLLNEYLCCKIQKRDHGKLKELSLDVAAGIIHLCDSIDQRTVIKNQLLRSGTSIGANVHEAEYAYSKADFAAKMQIALKECNESEYWLELWKRTIPVIPQELEQVQKLAKRLRFLLIQSLTKVKSN